MNSETSLGATGPTDSAGTSGAGDAPAAAPRRLPATAECSSEATAARLARLRADGFAVDHLAGSAPDLDPARLAGSIEGHIGYARVPIGVAGPLKVQGVQAKGDFFVPFATSEGTLVASFQHAFNAMNRSGGVRTAVTDERVGRAPCFEFADLPTAAAFVGEVHRLRAELEDAVRNTSRFCRLREVHPAVIGNTVYVMLEFATGDAAGQNMVTAGAQAVCECLLANAVQKPLTWLVESALSGDKRATAMAFRGARGRNASAEIVLSPKVLRGYWRADPAAMVRCWQQAVAGMAQSGATGLQGNAANAVAALFIACGQDVACVCEASTALTRVELTREGDVYLSVTLPNLIVGTVGGGTYLPTAQECLAMLGCRGTGNAAKFAEIIAAVVLAGELSIVGAMAGGAFAGAHASGGRKALGTAAV